MYVYIGFKTFFYVVRHLDSIASYLPTGLHLGFFRSWTSLFLPSSFSSVFLVLSFVSASTSMLFWAVFLLPFFEVTVTRVLVQPHPSTRNTQTHTHTHIYNFLFIDFTNSGPGSVAGIATTYGLDGLGIESWWGRDFPNLSRSALRPTQPPVQLVPGLSRG